MKGYSEAYLCKMGNSNSFSAYAMNFFRSVLEIPPIGFTSALEQLHDQRESYKTPLVGLDSLVFGVISPQTLVDVGASQYEQPSDFASNPR